MKYFALLAILGLALSADVANCFVYEAADTWGAGATGEVTGSNFCGEVFWTDAATYERNGWTADIAGTPTVDTCAAGTATIDMTDTAYTYGYFCETDDCNVNVDAEVEGDVDSAFCCLSDADCGDVEGACVDFVCAEEFGASLKLGLLALVAALFMMA